ncbi:helix-turn-helix domain-containing protein [Pseudonocardia abyssalis]|uniref:Helix-turn-helix domain-containing protein n=1 Tax=Pseudonocardia abyssalis TaxID=2792008 RepID=A0ABS6UXU6_9PSEU|nr:helix-turn-helix domain-containing protein [Pseudonocardia abyssalis]MBW0114862.1 helix-turn-helix domain-containing protein [Pseudonocardia abyssalis]MBW0137052.1 helix-turn-helix domain-containing protein [Pseudonocardia abyssalis]
MAREHGTARGHEAWATGPGDRASQWREMLSATHLPWTVSVPDAPAFDARIRRWWIDDLALVDCACGPCSGTRQRRQVADTDGEFVTVLITRAGRETVSQCGVEAELKPGDVVAWDSTKPARFAVWEPLSKRSLLIPRAALDEVSGRTWVTGGIRLDGRSPATRLLTTYLDTLSMALPDLPPSAVAAARNATLELFIGALRADGDVPSTSTARPALRASMDRFIEQHLLDAVTPTSIASAHGVSIRTVNRVFNATGQTVGEVIRVRRLARARDDLTKTDRPISVIAHRWGFSDISHFSRTFKARYGRSPSDYRGGAHVQRPGAAVQRGGVRTDETGVTADRD